jgi:cell pole-organizing protein PopZ
MSDKPTTDPSMDEILASIRRIISDDPAPAENADASPPPAVEPSGEPLHEDAMPDTASRVPSSHADEPLVGDAAANASASAFDTLAATAQDVAAARPVLALPAPGRTLEDLTADLLRPLLKIWLDENLPDIVRDRVDEEVRRIARSRVR